MMNCDATPYEISTLTTEDVVVETDTKVRVLLAEDDYMVAVVVRLMLENQGYDVVETVKDGKAAVASAIELTPDVVVMDLKMPVMNGLEATRRILETHPIPVIILSAYASPEWEAKVLEAGAAKFLVKPATEQDIAAAIRCVLSHHVRLT